MSVTVDLPFNYVAEPIKQDLVTHVALISELFCSERYVTDQYTGLLNSSVFLSSSSIQLSIPSGLRLFVIVNMLLFMQRRQLLMINIIPSAFIE